MKTLLYIIICLFLSDLYAQQEIIFTKDFTDKLYDFGLEVYKPTDDWLHPTYLQEDDFSNYDLTLVSEDDSVEMRFIFKEIENSQSFLNFPHLEFSRLMSEMATHNERAYIKVGEIPSSVAKNKYKADWGLEGDFVPNETITTKRKGRSLLLFKEDHSIVIALIFYDKKFLPQFYKLPISYLD